MNNSVLFRFLAADRLEWVLDGAPPQQGTPNELALHAKGRRLVLAAAGEAVVLARAKVPGRQRATRQRAIPYALEDSLAGDVEDLHFAIGDAAGNDTPAAVVRRKTLDDWLAACNQAGLMINAVVPEPLLLPFEAGSWSVLAEAERALVRTGPCDGFAGERDNLRLLLELALAEAGGQSPQQLRIWGGALPELDDLAVNPRYEATPPRPLQVMAAGLRQGQALNLLQGPYSRRAQLGKWLHPWRTAAALAGLWLCVQIALQSAEYWQLGRERSGLETAMARVYKEAVPSAVRIVNPRVQLETRLRQLRRGGDGEAGEFLDLLYQGGHILAAFEGITVRGLRYRNAQLDLDLRGESLEALDRLRQRFAEQAGLSVEMRTTKREGEVESRLTLKRASS